MTEAIRPHELPSALDAFPHLRVLSLDCFDTLLWRDTHAPTDLFSRLPEITPLQRGEAESRARSVAKYGRNRNEVTIAEIYEQLLPNAAAGERDAAVAAELTAEARHCYAFAPTVQLMRKAKARGLQVVIVSDTYLDPGQLRDLIVAAAGAEVGGLIDRIFCSSTFGKPKAQGLYGDVLRKLSAKPNEILHIGDNPRADVQGVAPFGVHTLHLQQFSMLAEQRFRQEAAISALYHVREDRDIAAPLPHRAALALAEPTAAGPAEALGLAVMGPMLHGFERWLEAEAAELQARCDAKGQGKVHWLFLMRDGHLPKLVHEAAGGVGHALEISRFTAIAASLRHDADPLHYVELELGLRPQTLARQLLMPETQIAGLMDGRSPSDASIALLVEMRKKASRAAILGRTRDLAQRLVAHVRAVADPAPGDTLMLVDLGYNGTVQNHVDELLREELGVHVAGRYLVLCEQDRPGFDKRGLIGLDNYDELSLRAICHNVTLLEQICTTAIGSVVDYAEDGAPIRKAPDIKGSQSEVREAIQQGCLKFAAAQRDAVIRADMGRNAADDVALWRKAAAAVIGRILYLPLAPELAVVETFQHDVNMGTDRTVALFKPEVAEQGLRQRGLFYLNGSERLYLPAELMGHGLAPKLTLLANRRFGLPFQFADFSDTAISLPVVYIAGEQLIERVVDARPTHDGFYLAAIPIGDCRFSVAVRFGAVYEYVQIDSVNAAPVETFLDDKVREDAGQAPVAVTPEAMQQLSRDLYRSLDESGFVMIAPPERVDDTPMMLAVVFRPIAGWPQASAPNAAPGQRQVLEAAA